ncbi:MAG: SPFH domain-containing protein [Armatimonadota bacterium]
MQVQSPTPSQYKQVEYRPLPGFLGIVLFLGLIALGIAFGAMGLPFAPIAPAWFVLAFVLLGGLVVVNPNESRVLVLFGRYLGTLSRDGFWYVNPFTSKRTVSLRARNFETTKLKVNDSHSNPIEIGAIVVWKVVDPAEALFEVEDYVRYVQVQSEAALRNVAVQYPYDAHKPAEHSLSTHTAEVSTTLEQALRDRLAKAGVEVVEARISHLAYAPEIAAAMLQRQQASAIVAARTLIVEGAVGMVDLALTKLKEEGIVELDEERKAQMVGNLLVVLCSDRPSQPVVSAGSN